MTSTSAGPGCGKGGSQGGFDVDRLFDANALNADGVGERGEAGVVEVGGVGDDAGSLHLEFDECESAVVEDDHLDGQLLLAEGEEIAEHHGEAAVAREGYDLAAGEGGLCADGLWDGAGHGSVIEGAEEAAAPVHGEIAGGPDGGCAYVAGEDGVVGCELVDEFRQVLRVDGGLVVVRARLAPRGLREPFCSLWSLRRGASRSVLVSRRGSRAARVSLIDPTRPRSTLVRRPIWLPRMSIWMTFACLGKNCL